MFEVVISQGHPVWTILRIYAPFMGSLLVCSSLSCRLSDQLIQPDGTVDKTVKKCHSIIHRVAGHLIQEKKRKIKEGDEIGITYNGKDLLSLLRE